MCSVSEDIEDLAESCKTQHKSLFKEPRYSILYYSYNLLNLFLIISCFCGQIYLSFYMN